MLAGEKADNTDILNPDWIPWRKIGKEERCKTTTNADTIVDHDYAPETWNNSDCDFKVLTENDNNIDLEFDNKLIDSETNNIHKISGKLVDHMDHLNKIRDEISETNKID